MTHRKTRPVGVEKLKAGKTIQMRSRQDALQTVCGVSLTIHHPQNHTDLVNIEFFNTTPVRTNRRKFGPDPAA
jgi:hypothetical protein